MQFGFRKALAFLAAALLALVPSTPVLANGYGPSTATPTKHLVVIFQENVSFDHYLVPTQTQFPTRTAASISLGPCRLPRE